VLSALGVLPALASAQECGDPFHNHYGPFDYRTTSRQNRELVERYHFTQDVATLKRGASTIRIGADIAYTLRVFPNHPHALMAMANLARRERNETPRGAEEPLSCWFERAVKFRPDDAQVRLVIGTSLLRSGKTSEGIEQLKVADKLMPKNANVNYNLGLGYYQAKNYEAARVHAKVAYDLGFRLPGLRDMLTKVGYWP
jgi:Flp pilus assembly protein TadD